LFCQFFVIQYGWNTAGDGESREKKLNQKFLILGEHYNSMGILKNTNGEVTQGQLNGIATIVHI